MTPVLLDTSVLRRHFAGKLSAAHAKTLAELFDEDDAVLIHPWVIGELTLGGMSVREAALLQRLPRAAELESEEILEFIRRRRLSRRGIGWVDAHLLASALISASKLWTLDSDLQNVAKEIGAAFSEGA